MKKHAFFLLTVLSLSLPCLAMEKKFKEKATNKLSEEQKARYKPLFNSPWEFIIQNGKIVAILEDIPFPGPKVHIEARKRLREHINNKRLELLLASKASKSPAHSIESENQDKTEDCDEEVD